MLRNLGGHPGPATLQGRRRERFTRRHLFVRCVWKIGNEILADFNDNYNDEEDPRIPVILRPEDYDYWLTRDEINQPRTDLLVPYDAHRMSA